MKPLLLLRFCLQDLAYDWRRSLLNLLKLTAMIATYLLVAVLGQSFQSLSTSFVHSAQNLLIVSKHALDPMDSSLTPALLEEAVGAVREAFGEEAVVASAPVFFRQMRVKDRMFQVLAGPPDLFETVFQLHLVEGRWPAALDEVIASQGAARNAGWSPGHQMTLHGQVFTLTGIMETSSRGAASLWMTYPAGVALFGLEGGVQFGTLHLNPGADATAIQEWLEKQPLLEGRYAVYKESQLSEQIAKALKGLQPMGHLFSFMALLVVVFGGYNVASLTLQERQPEIAILYQVHFSRRGVGLFVILRGALLALAAFPLGWAAALLSGLTPGAPSPQAGLIIYGAHLNLALNRQTAWVGLLLVLASMSAGTLMALAGSVTSSRELVPSMSEHGRSPGEAR